MVYSHDIIYYDKLRHKYENGEPCVNIIDRAKTYIDWKECFIQIHYKLTGRI